MELLEFKTHYWPILTCFWLCISFVITYLVTVLREPHAYYLLPYISETGELPPESCIFSELIYIGTLLLGVCLYIRHKQVDLFIKTFQLNLHKMWNKCGGVCATLMCISATMVATFQQNNAPYVHFPAAFLLFMAALVYFFIQTRISGVYAGNYDKTGVSKNLYVYRVFLFLSMLVSLLLYMIFKSMEKYDVNGTSATHNSRFSLKLVLFVLLYVLSFKTEFKIVIFRGIRSGLGKILQNCISNTKYKIHCREWQNADVFNFANKKYK